MSKRRPGTDKGQVQLTLPVSSLPTAGKAAGSLRAKEAVREVLSAALDRSGLDREYVASELGRLVGENISIHTLHSYTADSKGERRLPLEYVAALSCILGDTSIAAAALGAAGLQVLGPKERKIYELGRITVEKRKRSKQERQLWEQLYEEDD